MQVRRDHKRHRVIAPVRNELRLDSGELAGPISVAPVEDHPLQQDDRLPQSVLSNVVGHLLKLAVGQHREQLGNRMGLHWR